MIELSIILALLVFNGIFAMAEIALVSAKRARLQQRAQEGNKGAQKALELTKNPERFLSTVQIGITLVGVLAGAFGGASLSGYIQPLLEQIPVLVPYAERLAFGIVVAFITYLSLIIGELTPKNLALRNPEGIACAMAGPMDWLSRATYPLVWLLELSTRVVMKIFGSGPAPTGPTAEEVIVLLREGMVSGGVRAEESEMVEGIFDLREMRAEEIMRPKPKMVFFHVSDKLERILPRVAETRQSVFPVYEHSRDNVVGLVSLRDLFTSLAGGGGMNLVTLMKEPLFVSDNQPALSLMEQLRKAPHYAGLVTDEFGILRGLVTLDDLAEEIVGDLDSRPTLRYSSQMREVEPNVWLADGLMEIDKVTEQIEGLNELVDEEKEAFQTLGGYIVHLLKRLPIEGESFQVGNFRFEIVDMDRQRIDKIQIKRLPPQIEPPTGTPEAGA